MEPTQHTTGNVVTTGALAAAMVSAVQLGIELAVPNALWTVVQTKTQYWTALQVLVAWALLRFCPRCFTTKGT